MDALLGTDGSDLPVEICQTRAFPPSLTLLDAASKIKEAVEQLKLNPPSSRSGFLRFQVSVPPSLKALDWLSSQTESSVAFPQFYLSVKHFENQPHELISSHQMVGVSGIGSAVHFAGSSSSEAHNSLERYLSVDAPHVNAFGFIGFNYDWNSSSMKHEAGSFYFFIPQIELDEFETTSLLVANLVWDESISHTFEKAVRCLELTLRQSIFNVCPIQESRYDKWIRFNQGNLTMKEDQNIHMVCLNANSLLDSCTTDNKFQLEDAPTSDRFYFKLSMTLAFSSKMVDGPSRLHCSLQECANINFVWASLVIEECTRLGLTYFCIAPGSRSSPLAIAASSHSHTTCISCIDERSLAFHAVGYARGSLKPAVIITSSGTAVSNLLPAVVEASNDFIPLLLLTADRPPELYDAGANQSINQVNHFGSFVRFFFNLPPPTDHIPARMVLTTVDSAVYRATQTPCGPVHLNCGFREPLEDSPREWALNCLKGLSCWMSNVEPFTRYIRLQHIHACDDTSGQVAEVLEIIRCANQGLLLIGGLQTEDEIQAVIFLAKHLSWPVVADILSGLRLRKALNPVSKIEDNFLFLDHLDHALLSDSVKVLMKPDVVVQIGGRITSKRITQMLEACCPFSYIMVDKHPYRHDPSHIVTHRIQSTITEFAHYLLKVSFPRKTTRWHTFLQVLNMMVSWEISFQIHFENSLTEPHVARVVSESLQSEDTLFLGNSMVIRDADMYGRGWANSTTNIAPFLSNWELPCQGIRVSGNRGASGIDGLLSTAIGYAVGCNKRVVCMIGDISLLHDTNGLAILNQRTRRKPMTILVNNNHGGAIFSLLPIANRTQSNILDKYFYTSHDVLVRKLCEAHSVKHVLVRTKSELRHALSISLQLQTDCVIEIESSIENNATFHRYLTKSAGQAANHALSVLSRLSIPDHVSSRSFLCKIKRMEYSSYRIQLSAPPTSTAVSSDCNGFYKEGFILTISLEDGSVGFGEVAPMEIHKEDLLDVEEQLRCLIHMFQGAGISYYLPLLKGSFSSWIWKTLGIPLSSIFPSVRCGLEMAILNALAARQGSSLSDLILGYESSGLKTQLDEADKTLRPPRVQICALLDSNGTPKEVAHIVAQLVDEGFTTIKLKVARRVNPVEDAAVVQEIRRKVGYQIKLRVDANRKWTYEAAIEFGSHVKHCDLQYIEEPVNLEDDIIKFCEETGLPVALDETIDNIKGDPLDKLIEFMHPGIVAVVIKPSVVGGFENATLIAKWAHHHKKLAVISSAFESSLSLSVYIQFAYYLEQQRTEISQLHDLELAQSTVHGLGTYRWLKEDITTLPLNVCIHANGDKVEASVEDASFLVQNFKMKPEAVQRSYCNEQVLTYNLTVDYGDFFCTFRVRDAGSNINNKVVIFLHGFLGTGEDWVPIMKALSATTRCISIDLPGHGKSYMRRLNDTDAKQEKCFSFEAMADLLHKLICSITPERVILAGYSMGARIALYMALRYNAKIAGAVVISGSPGLRDEALKRSRSAQDDARAQYLAMHGLECFLDTWYAGELWNSLQEHPHFKQIVGSRAQHDDLHALANSLSDLSLGRQPSMWEDLKKCETPLLVIVGEKDRKFKQIAEQMQSEISSCVDTEANCRKEIYEMFEVPECGHAVHLENPLPVINAVRKFIHKLE